MTTTAVCARSSRISRLARASGGDEGPNRVSGQRRLREEPGRGARVDQVGELLPGVGRDQDHGSSGSAASLGQVPRKIETAGAAQVDINERHVRAQLADLADRRLAGRGHANDRDPLLLEEGAGRLEEAHAVVNDQAAQSHSLIIADGRQARIAASSNPAPRRRAP